MNENPILEVISNIFDNLTFNEWKMVGEYFTSPRTIEELLKVEKTSNTEINK
jgi:hypothetical protein